MKPKTRSVLRALEAGPRTTHDLCQPEVGGVRFGARIEELRNEFGYVIDERRQRPGSSVYTLRGRRGETPSDHADVRIDGFCWGCALGVEHDEPIIGAIVIKAPAADELQEAA